jgi:flagellum-specific peptidoglycan hydrolase FlgJ
MIYAGPRPFVLKRNILFLLIAATALTSCSVHKKATVYRPPVRSAVPLISNSEAKKNNEMVQKVRSEAIASFVPYTVATYIDRFKTIAIQEMNLYGIPASITLAQGLFESGNGNSDLSKIANNHFGIKCTSDWKDKSYYKDDDQVNDCFRVYDKPEDSYRDHSEFLKRKRYAPLFELDKNDYQGWAQRLKRRGLCHQSKISAIVHRRYRKISS